MNKFFLNVLGIGILLFLAGCVSNKDSARRNGINKEYSSEELRVDALFLDACTNKELGNYDKALSLYDSVISKNPNYSSAYYERANILFSKKEAIKAIESNKKAISLSPKNIWYRLQLIQIYINIGDFETAANSYEDLITLYPNKIDYYKELVEVYNQKGDEKNMLKTLNRIEVKWGKDEEISMFKFRYFINKGNYSKAEAEIEGLKSSHPNQIKYLAILAEVNMKKENYPKALEYYEKIREIDPNDPYINVSLANLYFIKKDKTNTFNYLNNAIRNKNLDYKTKIQVLLTIYGKTADENRDDFNSFFSLLKTLSQDYPSEKTIWELLSTGYMKTSQFEEAVIAIKKAIKIGEEAKGKHSNEFELYKNLLFALSTLNQPDSVIKESLKTIEIFPEQPLPYLFLGTNYLYTSKYEDAASTLQNGSKLVVDDNLLLEDFYSNLAEAYYKINNYKLAYEYFDKTLILNPNNYIVLNNYAYYLALKEENLDKAERMARKVFEKYPNNPTYIDTYAWVLYMKKDYKGAYKVLQNIIGEKSNWGETLTKHYELILKALNH